MKKIGWGGYIRRDEPAAWDGPQYPTMPAAMADYLPTEPADSALLRIIGTGDSAAVDFWNSSYLIETHGKRLLIDCGFTIKYALRDLGLTLANIDAVFITHVHGDHIYGLERLGFESRYTYGRRPQLLLAPGIRPELWEHCLRGTMGSEDNSRLEDYFDVEDVGSDGFQWEGVDLRLFPTLHVPNKPSYGLIINDRVIVTSDSKPLEWLARDRSDRVIVHDCSLSPFNPVHATLDELMRYPAPVRRRVWVTHYGDEIERYRERIEREFAGVAAQGQTIPLPQRVRKAG